MTNFGQQLAVRDGPSLARLVGLENTYVIDHGSTDGSTFPYAANCVRLPRRFNGADIRLPIVTGMQQMLLTEYDVVIYADCDEFLVVDPARHASLHEALAANEAPIVRCLGADIVHLPAHEPEPLDFDAPILEQRLHWYYSRPISKPIITRAVADWVPGFHFVRGHEKLEPNPAFLLLHMRWADVGHGEQDWPAIKAELDRQGVDHWVIEHDNPKDHARLARRSLEAVQGW